ncbi:hypothetical protein NL676_036214 [Syzygium grande]|nr:hypothetical protein NL676_036214 [Syzygium grande]
MLRRKPSKIEVKIEDKDELEDARKRSAAAAAAASAGPPASSAAGTSSILQHLDRPSNLPSKSHRIGLSPST